jgi:hypothetical protein
VCDERSAAGVSRVTQRRISEDGELLFVGYRVLPGVPRTSA